MRIAARPVLGWLLAATLVAGACSDGADPTDVAGGDGTTSVVPGAAGTSVAEAPGDAPPEAEVPERPPGDSPPAPGSPPPEPPPTQPGAPTTTAAAPAPGAVGAFAPFFLRPAESRSIVVEIRSQAGAEPRAGTVSHLRQVLRANSGKDVGVAGGALPGGARSWSADEIRALADEGGRPQSREAAVMRILFLRGGFAESDTALGLAVRSDVAAVFSDRVDEAAGLTGNAARIEDAVTIHEAGHLLGLVDLHLSTGREDPEHPGHSRNRNSVMYYAVESTLVGSILGGGPPTEFDAEDRADLEAIRRS